jgi:4a-hydroxytetrahydrobiopterin dehydratase
MRDWKESDFELSKTFVFDSFKEAIHWMVKASIEMEKQNHHAIWTNEYNKVHVRLTTHDAGNIVSQKDRELASLLDLIDIKK